MYDIVILTERRYDKVQNRNWYTDQVILEDQIVQISLEKKGFKVVRVPWDIPNFDWTKTKFALFRTTWDYFDRYEAFLTWFEKTRKELIFINDPKLIYWNLDKHYLLDLKREKIKIPKTIFLDRGHKKKLKKILQSVSWDKAVLKPAIGAAARETFLITRNNYQKHEKDLQRLCKNESMLFQEFQYRIQNQGEISFIMIGGKFTHAVLKKAKAGDFRVQDDFGGSVQDYHPSKNEIEFAKFAIRSCPKTPIYARVDAFYDNENELCLGELELIEPELWFRKCPAAADILAEEIYLLYKQIFNNE
jgi:hypothetical protein